jgi:hypothetical protein
MRSKTPAMPRSDTPMPTLLSWAPGGHARWRERVPAEAIRTLLKSSIPPALLSF